MPTARGVIAIDVGNTRVKAGQIHVEQGRPQVAATVHWSNGDSPPWETFRQWCAEAAAFAGGENGPLRVIAAATNPAVLEGLLAGWNGRPLPPIACIDDFRQLPLTVDVTYPERVGIDRLLNGLAAHRLVESSAAKIIVDSGSATTVDVVDAAGVFRGGAILPGFALTALALHQYTAKLPLVEYLPDRVPVAIGKETVSAIRSGLYWGQIGAIRELVGRMAAELQPHEGPVPQVILSGGGSDQLRDAFPDAVWLPDLTLQGLALAAEHGP